MARLVDAAETVRSGLISATTLQLTVMDGYLLSSLPEIGCELGAWIHAYTFFHRDAAPTYPELAGCVERATSTGVMPPPGDGRFRLTPLWQERVSEFIEAERVTEYGMFEFAEWLAGQKLVITGTGFALAETDYLLAVGSMPQRVHRS